MEKGVVFDIQRFSLHDGPGIRTTVFMKGCPLRCAWCHNPESWEKQPQQMKKADGRVWVCGSEMTTEEVMDEVMADWAYYQNSGGGMTVSGGEPMLQFGFVLELLREAKRKGIHTCMETSGYAAPERFAEILPYVDLFLWDIKEMDPEKHKAYTGVDNRRILENLDALYRLGAKILIRCPVIPGINDSDEHIRAIARLTKKYAGLLGVEVMPYHDMGKGKWKEIGRLYTLSQIRTVTGDEKQELLRRFKEAGCLNVSV